MSSLFSYPLSESRIIMIERLHRFITMPESKYTDITEKIIGASFEVHKFLGNGFQELIYQRALAWELTQAGLSYVRKLSRIYFIKNSRSRLAQGEQTLLWKERF